MPNLSTENQESHENQNDLKAFNLLIKLKQNVKYEEITNDTLAESTEHKFVIIIDNQQFIGTGQTRNVARTKAAQSALEKLFGMCFHDEGKIYD